MRGGRGPEAVHEAEGTGNPVTGSDLDVCVRVRMLEERSRSLRDEQRGAEVAGEGSVFRRCGCVDPVIGRGRAAFA